MICAQIFLNHNNYNMIRIRILLKTGPVTHKIRLRASINLLIIVDKILIPIFT